MKELIKYAYKKTDCFKINIKSKEEKELQIKNNQINSFSEKSKEAVSVSVWINKKLGVFTSNKISKEAIDSAIKIAKINKKEEYFYGLPERKKTENKAFFDDKLRIIDEESLIKDAKKVIKSIKDTNINISEAGLALSKEKRRVINSNGFDEQEESISSSLYAATIGKDKGKEISCWDSAEDVKKINIDDFCMNLKQKTKDALKAKQLKQKPVIVVLRPEVFSSLISRALLENFNGKNVEKSRSLFKDKKNKKIFDESLNITDKGNLNNGINSSNFDDEGNLSKKTEIIKDGYLLNFVYDHNTAQHAGLESTGNSFNGEISFTNVLFKGKEEIIKKALIVESVIGAHTSNPSTTEFSVKMESGYYLDDGRKVPVKGAMLYGKLSECLKGLVSFSGKEEQRDGIYCKDIALKGVKIN